MVITDHPHHKSRKLRPLPHKYSPYKPTLTLSLSTPYLPLADTLSF